MPAARPGNGFIKEKIHTFLLPFCILLLLLGVFFLFLNSVLSLLMPLPLSACSKMHPICSFQEAALCSQYLTHTVISFCFASSVLGHCEDMDCLDFQRSWQLFQCLLQSCTCSVQSGQCSKHTRMLQPYFALKSVIHLSSHSSLFVFPLFQALVTFVSHAGCYLCPGASLAFAASSVAV